MCVYTAKLSGFAPFPLREHIYDTPFDVSYMNAYQTHNNENEDGNCTNNCIIL